MTIKHIRNTLWLFAFASSLIIVLLALCSFNCSNGTDDDNGDGFNGPDTTDGDTLNHPPDSLAPGELTYIGSFLNIDTPGGKIFIDGIHAYIPQRSGFLIVDISDPENPQQAGQYSTSAIRYGISISVRDNIAYLLGWDWSSHALLMVLDVADALNPELKGQTDVAGQGYGIAFRDNHVYIAAGDQGVAIYKVSNPSEPQLVNTIPVSNASKLTIYRQFLLVASDTRNQGGWKYDISDPSEPDLLQHFYTPGYTRNITVKYNHVFVADGVYLDTSTGSFQVFALDDLLSPIACDSLQHGCIAVALWENFAYAVDWTGSAPNQAHLYTYDIYDPARPALISDPVNLEVAKDLAVKDGYIYVISQTTLKVIKHLTE
ncbi:hypothetical protein JW877_03465 [bacterium]|nr:hypothetical protein [bacterium]